MLQKHHLPIIIATVSLWDKSIVAGFLMHPSPSQRCHSGFMLHPSPSHRRHIPFLVDPKLQLANDEDQTPLPKIKRPANEFSRTVRTDSVLGARRGRDYSISIKANPEELEGLAKRFDLPDIAKLEADLVLRKDTNRSSGASNKGEFIKAEGSVTASLTQTCVRTNENFPVDLEFELFAAVRSAGSRDDVGSIDVSRASNRGHGGQKKKSRKSMRGSGRYIDEMGMKELQEIMEDWDVEEDVIEDEAVFDGGNLDCGELVAQLFRLKLDPYPKKPGSEPINISVSG